MRELLIDRWCSSEVNKQGMTDRRLSSTAALLAMQEAKQTVAGPDAWTAGCLTVKAPISDNKQGQTGILQPFSTRPANKTLPPGCEAAAATADNILDRLLERLASTSINSNVRSPHSPTTNQGSAASCFDRSSRHASIRSLNTAHSTTTNSRTLRQVQQPQHAIDVCVTNGCRRLAQQASIANPASREAASAISGSRADTAATGGATQPQHLGCSSSLAQPTYGLHTPNDSPVRMTRESSSVTAVGQASYSRSSSSSSDRSSNTGDATISVRRSPSSCSGRHGEARLAASRCSSRNSNSNISRSRPASAAASTADALLDLQQLVNPSAVGCAGLSITAQIGCDGCRLPVVRGVSAPRDGLPCSSQALRPEASNVSCGSSDSTHAVTQVAAQLGPQMTRRPLSRSSTSSSKTTIARSNTSTAVSPYSTTVDPNPAVWLQQQHPAVVAALTKDLAATAGTAQEAGDSAYAAQQRSGQEVQQPADSSTAYDLSGSKNKAAKPQQTLQLLTPLFPGTAPTLEFVAEPRQGCSLLIEQPLTACNDASAPQQQQQQRECGSTLQLQNVKVFVKYYGVANNAVKQVFKASGFKRTKGEGWNVLWGSLAPNDMLTGLNPLQKHNHFPGTWELGRKDRLYRTIAAAARRTKGKAFSFVPKFFVLPADADDFKLDLAQNPNMTYIRKPAASSRGRGVRVVKDAKALDLAALNDVILQHYIPNPLLVNGRKFDLRVYVAVTNLDPLRVYVYREGLVRFACEQYSNSKKSLNHATMHLTNYSVNKTAKNFQQPKGSPSQQQRKQYSQQQQSGPSEQRTADADGSDCGDGDGCESESESDDTSAACKWSFGQLAEHLKGQGHKWSLVWDQVCRICTETIIAAEPGLSSITRSTGGPSLMKNCFEVFGFDILLDQKMRAWLLEVNTCPALNADSPLDAAVKTNMVADVLGLVGITPCSREVYQQQQAAARQTRLTGLAASPGSPSTAATVGRSAMASPTKQQQRALGAAASAGVLAAAAKTVKEVEQLDLLAVLPDQLPESVRETEAEWRRCCRQQQRWQRVFPGGDVAVMHELLGLFETPRVNNAMVLRYYQLLAKQKR